MVDLLLPYIYLYVAFTAVFLLSLVCSDVKNNKKVFYCLAFVILLFVGFRDEYVGADTIVYVDFFHDKNFYIQNEKTDLFFEIIGRFLHFINDTTPFFIFSTSLLGLWGVFWMIHKLSYNKVLSMFLFLTSGTAMVTFFLYFCMIRQCIAATFFIIAVYMLFESKRKSKYTWTVVFYLMAILTHGSCLITVPIVAMVYYRPIGRKLIWFILIASTYILAVLNISFVTKTLNFVFGIVGQGKYAHYADVSFGGIEAKGFFNLDLLPYIGISLFVIWLASKKMLNAWYVQLFLFSTVLNNVFFDNLMWSRLILYISLFIIVALPNVYEKAKFRGKWVILTMFLCYFVFKDFGTLIKNIIMPSGNIIVPYESILF